MAQSRKANHTASHELAPHLFPDLVKCFYALTHSLERPVYLCLQLSICPHTAGREQQSRYPQNSSLISSFVNGCPRLELPQHAASLASDIYEEGVKGKR